MQTLNPKSLLQVRDGILESKPSAIVKSARLLRLTLTPSISFSISISASKRGSRPDVSDQDDDVELYSIESGWNESALLATSDDVLGGWVVESIGSSSYNFADLKDVVELESEFEEEDGNDEEGMADSTESFGDGFLGIQDNSTMYPTSIKRRKQSSGGDGSLGNAERELLDSFPRHIAKQLLAAHEERKAMSPAAQRKAAARLKTHRRLKIISGTAAGVRIVSPQGDQTRPMMELVRGAVFSMIASMHGCTESALPNDTRWLDLFAGTGAVGIEALSRGVGEAHFVELSPWVVKNCLEKNLELCGVDNCAIIHSTKAEDYLRRHRRDDVSQQVTSNTNMRNIRKVKAFDFISCCPPYENVSYTELFTLLNDSALIHDNTILIVEYPRKAVSEIPDVVGPLFKLRDRKYGRTLVALYGPQIDGIE